MIEKLMKAVKSSNKKRGRNITVGAVVGMLLSCTVAMGDEVVAGLDITTSGGIKFSKDGNPFIPGNEEEPNKDPYPDNSWDEGTKTYTNNSTIKIVKNTSSSTIRGYGINADISGEGINGIANKGMLNVSSNATDYSSYNSFAYGINIFSSVVGKKIEDITNDGVIDASVSKFDYIYSHGICTGDSDSESIEVGNIKNNGLINSFATNPSNENSGHGIYIFKAAVAKLKNTGRINASNYGIEKVSNKGSLGSLINNGMINASGYSSSGIDAVNSGKIDNITNIGAIYGKWRAVSSMNSGIVSSGTNYGLLMSGTSDGSVVDGGLSIVAHDDSTGGDKKIRNYGLAFAYTGSGYKNHGNSNVNGNFGEIYENVEIEGIDYTIRNVQATITSVSDGTLSAVKSFGIKDGALYGDIAYDNTNASSITGPISDGKATTDKVILNGIENTLKVVGDNSGSENSLSNSIINAYGTAVEFDSTSGGSLSLTNTTVNGGAKDDTSAILGSSGADTLKLKNTVVNGDIDMQDGANTIEAKEGTTINGNITTGSGKDTFISGSNVAINGDVNLGADDDVLTIGTGSFVNGILDGGTGTDTLTFGTNSGIGTASITEDNTEDSINISHDIKGFENINVGTKVTFASDIVVSDAAGIKIGTAGTLTLKVDSDITDPVGGAITGHALYTTTGTPIITSEGGKLLLDFNKLGNENTVSFGSTSFGTGLEMGSGTFGTTSKLHIVERISDTEVKIIVKANLPDYLEYPQLNKIYQSIVSVDNLIENFNVDDEGLVLFLDYLNDIYAGSPYSYSSELSRKSTSMFRDIVTDNQFKADTGKWMIYGGLTHVDGGTKDTYYGKGYYTYDIGSSDMDADTKITGAYMLGEYGISDTLTSGVVIGGNKLKSDLSNGSKVDGSALYIGAYAKKYLGNLKVTAGAGFQYGDYDADRLAVNRVASDSTEPVMKYSDNYNDITYDIYLNGRYSHNIGNNLFLEPYATLSYTYIDQDGANEESKTLAIETDSKSFDYTVGKVGVDLKKVIPHEKGKSTLSAGVSYTKILDGADEEHITGRFKGGSNFDILVAHKNEHNIGLNAKYALELENGVIFDVKGTYSVERDSHNQSGKNRTKGEWIVGVGIGYKF